MHGNKNNNNNNDIQGKKLQDKQRSFRFLVD